MEESFDISEKEESQAGEAELKFIFSQAESQLKESIESGKDVLTRSVIILTVLIGFITSISGYLISLSSKPNFINVETLTFLTTLIYLLYILYKIHFNLKGHDYYTTGAQPIHLLHTYYFKEYKTSDKRILGLYLSEIKEYQGRIEKNNVLNKERWKSFGFCLKRFINLPIFIIVIFLLFQCLHFLFVWYRVNCLV